MDSVIIEKREVSNDDLINDQGANNTKLGKWKK